jgi:hypothetical protein
VVQIGDHLVRQLDVAWGLLSLHMTGLDDGEALWRPTGKGPHVRLASDGEWIADWPEREDYTVGLPSIAWVSWHIGFWWSMVQDHSFGDGSLRREDVTWPGTVDSVRAWLTSLRVEWVRCVSGMSDEDFESRARTRWPMNDRPFADVAAWVNVELMKNAAEIGFARFLYAARSE